VNASNDDEFNAEQNAMNAATQAEVDARNRQGLDIFPDYIVECSVF